MYQPKFTITNAILKNIGAIEACREIIEGAPLLPFYEKQFRDSALVRAVHYGTHIEGNGLNLDQAERVILGQEVIGRERDIQEIINYRKVMDYISEFAVGSTEGRITESTIRKLHRMTVEKILPREKCGEYRKTQVVIKNNQTLEVSFRPPPSEQVESQIADLVAFVDESSAETIHPVLKAGVIHYELVRIHPFLDGNGRVARALSTLILFMEGYDIRKFFSLEEYFDKDANSYYGALQSVESQGGDLTLWLEYFTKGLGIELSKIKEKVERISVDGKLRQRLGGKPVLLSERQLKIIEYIQETGYLQNKAFYMLFPMVSEDTILNELKALIEHGVIKKHGSTKGAKYVL
ncbi:Fic family protein [Patescibacteria group bacterium]|nr:Fic family protein [Patescibacteria group bacterium]MCL5010029.1 Fic family protein [Patescibacteria group bacterium]